MNWLAEQEDKYYTWLRSKTYIPVGDESDWSLISTPFTGLFNDTLVVVSVTSCEACQGWGAGVF